MYYCIRILTLEIIVVAVHNLGFVFQVAISEKQVPLIPWFQRSQNSAHSVLFYSNKQQT